MVYRNCDISNDWYYTQSAVIMSTEFQNRIISISQLETIFANITDEWFFSDVDSQIRFVFFFYHLPTLGTSNFLVTNFACKWLFTSLLHQTSLLCKVSSQPSQTYCFLPAWHARCIFYHLSASTIVNFRQSICRVYNLILRDYTSL